MILLDTDHLSILRSDPTEQLSLFTLQSRPKCEAGVPTILGVQPTGINRGCSIFRLKATSTMTFSNSLKFPPVWKPSSGKSIWETPRMVGTPASDA